MARIINEFTNGNVGVVSAIGTDSFAYDVYDALKQVNEQLAIYFWEQYKYYKVTGHLMAA